MTATSEGGHFVIRVNGRDDRRFTTLQRAIDDVSGRSDPTGSIVYLPAPGAAGRTVVTFVDGEIELVAGPP
ncbi:hypothetical protein CIW49_26235 [Mycolicibacterium sp. P1-18]|uniref:hypothetical protein n=1 Tax=Mycolicibacterium sp. P1-18 TaxID=2024615 RepID=UPI0011F37D04|nr:hypothetical protein [Mycolicibacterium sp. P1-18]KAA0093565.1 hypothetical protein CIW49_26235 [Mycolicibacterium sp. P1-18]